MMKKVFKTVLLGFISLVILAGIADVFWIYGPQVMASQSIPEVVDEAQKVANLTVPNEAQIIALGEATHGNADFQGLKLATLKRLVATQGVKALALEADYGEMLAINRYIHGENSDTKQLVTSLSFEIYHTKQMIDLIEWMRYYNQGKSENDQLSIYGFDMQSPEKEAKELIDFAKAYQLASTETVEKALQPLVDGTYNYDPSANQTLKAQLDILKQDLNQLPQTQEKALQEQAIVTLSQGLDFYGSFSGDFVSENNKRDQFMAQNVSWLANVEKKQTGGKLLISGHNGHVSKQGRLFTTMGQQLSTAYDSQYFVIGTDFWETKVNIADRTTMWDRAKGRQDHTFNSADPLAAQAKQFGGSYYLNFTELTPGSKLDAMLHSPMTMGSLGENYDFMMTFLPTTYRYQSIPVDHYDAMIFVDKARPIEVIEE